MLAQQKRKEQRKKKKNTVNLKTEQYKLANMNNRENKLEKNE